MMREFGGMKKVRLVRGMMRLIKSTSRFRDSNEDEIEDCRATVGPIFSFSYFTTHACDIQQWNESKGKGGYGGI